MWLTYGQIDNCFYRVALLLKTLINQYFELSKQPQNLLKINICIGSTGSGCIYSFKIYNSNDNWKYPYFKKVSPYDCQIKILGTYYTDKLKITCITRSISGS